MEQDTVEITPHLDGDQRTDPGWALLCLLVGVWLLVCASAFFATINVGRVR